MAGQADRQAAERSGEAQRGRLRMRGLVQLASPASHSARRLSPSPTRTAAPPHFAAAAAGAEVLPYGAPTALTLTHAPTPPRLPSSIYFATVPTPSIHYPHHIIYFLGQLYHSTPSWRPATFST